MGAASDLYRCAVRCSDTNGSDVVNVHHFMLQTAADPTDATIAAELKAKLETAYTTLNAVQTSAFNPVDIKIDQVTWNGADETVVLNLGTYTFGGTYNPTASGDDLPPGVAGFVKLLTNLGKVYGRKFLAGMLEANNVSGFYNSTVVTALTNYAAHFLGSWTGASGNVYQNGVLSKKLGAFAYIIAARVPNVFAYQRRRRQGTGS